jgi:hypothetical protein
VHDAAGGTSGRGESGEIDMRGQVGVSGRAKRVGRPAGMQRLQAVAERADGRTVVEEKGGPLVRDAASGQGGDEGLGGFVPFQDRAVGYNPFYSPCP